MSDDGTALSGSLSEEEQGDLEKLIQELKADPSGTGIPAGGSIEELREQVRSTAEQLSKLAQTVLRMDAKIRSLSQIMQLFHKKSELMNQRIDGFCGPEQSGNQSNGEAGF